MDLPDSIVGGVSVGNRVSVGKGSSVVTTVGLGSGVADGVTVVVGAASDVAVGDM